MIKVSIPPDNELERRYILEVLLSEFLNLEFHVEISDDNLPEYEIETSDGAILVIQDHFFSHYPNALSYLSEKNIPDTCLFARNQFTYHDDVPIIFGSDVCTVTENKIVCGADVFASSFFFLSRWEEYVCSSRDTHQRFSSELSFARNADILDRPVVNEYVEMLAAMLAHLGVETDTRKRLLTLTHDVDALTRWSGPALLIKVVANNILKDLSPVAALENIAEYFLIRRRRIPDPYDHFEWLMERSEALGKTSIFYFISGGNSIYDAEYALNDQACIQLIDSIKHRGHSIGLHPSYDTYNNRAKLQTELSTLQQAIGGEVSESRQHYLRFEVPTTWQILEDLSIAVDSSCGFADHAGFRCGTGDEYSVFNVLTREKLQLKERPLVVMDCSLFTYNDLSYSDAMQSVEKMLAAPTSLTMLWHNSYTVHMPFYKTFIERRTGRQAL